MRIALEITFSQGNSVARYLPRRITALSARVAGPTIPTPTYIYTATVVCTAYTVTTSPVAFLDAIAFSNTPFPPPQIHPADGRRAVYSRRAPEA